MLPIEDQISILVHLSKADGNVANEEKKLIYGIGSRLELTEEQVDELINDPKPIPSLDELPPAEKFEYLFNTIQLMKVDRKIYQKEIEFCEKLAIRLGYKPGVVADLSAYIYSDPDIRTKTNFLRSVADQHLI